VHCTYQVAAEPKAFNLVAALQCWKDLKIPEHHRQQAIDNSSTFVALLSHVCIISSNSSAG
jgi:hypothetical protein